MLTSPSLYLPPGVGELYKNPDRSILTARLTVYGTITLPNSAVGSVKKIPINTVETDNMGWWFSQGERYSPQKSGFYAVSAFYTAIENPPPKSGQMIEYGVYKNGKPIAPYSNSIKRVTLMDTSGKWGIQDGYTWIVEMNGTTDYIEVFANCTTAAEKGRMTLTAASI